MFIAVPTIECVTLKLSHTVLKWIAVISCRVLFINHCLCRAFEMFTRQGSTCACKQLTWVHRGEIWLRTETRRNKRRNATALNTLTSMTLFWSRSTDMKNKTVTDEIQVSDPRHIYIEMIFWNVLLIADSLIYTLWHGRRKRMVIKAHTYVSRTHYIVHPFSPAMLLKRWLVRRGNFHRD